MDIVEGVLGGVACPGDADLLSTLTLDVDVAVRFVVHVAHHRVAPRVRFPLWLAVQSRVV
jgi:hypothetical protein